MKTLLSEIIHIQIADIILAAAESGYLAINSGGQEPVFGLYYLLTVQVCLYMAVFMSKYVYIYI